MYFMLLPLVLFIPVGIYYYFFLKRIASLFNFKYKKLVKIILIVLAVIIEFLTSNVFSVWVVIFMHIFVFALLMDLVAFALQRLDKESNTFRKIYLSGLIPIILTCGVLVYANYNIKNVVLKEYTVYSEKQLNNSYKVALISDLHFGTTMDEEKLESISKEIGELNPSFVVLAGDIVDENTSKEEMKNAFAILGKIKSEYGVFFIYGNHDKSRYYGNQNYSVSELEKAIDDANIIPLVDESYTINDELILFGRDDLSFPKGESRLTSSELLKDVDTNKYLLLVDHHPADLKENAKAGFDLQLSGHTHGGQIFPTGLFSEWFNINSMNYGYRKIDNLNIIVSSGMGGWSYPFRTGTHSEYVIVNIKNK